MKKYRLRDWYRVNFYPFFTPPEGSACEAVNIARHFARLDYMDYSRQDLISKPIEEFSLQEAEEVEEWVDEKTFRYRYYWADIERFWNEDEDSSLQSWFDHCMRIGHGKGVQPREDGEVYHYRQAMASKRHFSNAKVVSGCFVALCVMFLFLLDAEVFSFHTFSLYLWGVAKVVTYWLVDIAAPLLFLGTTAVGVGRWLNRRLQGKTAKQLCSQEKDDE